MSSPVQRLTVSILAVLACSASACSAQPEGDQTQEGSGRARALEAIDVEFPSGEIRLAGTLFRPEGKRPLPGVVLLGGSDRGPRGPIKTRLARSLAEGDAAVLTYDSPGTGGSGGDALFQTRGDRAREAVAAARFLRTIDGVDPERVGLCGGSEGAKIALLGAALDPEIAFAIAVSGGFGMSMMELSRYRIEALGLRRGLSRGEIDRALALEELLYALLTGPDVVEWRFLQSKTAGWPDEPWEELIGLVRQFSIDLSDEDKAVAWDRLQRILRGWMNEPWFELAVVDRRNLERVLAMDAPAFFAFQSSGPIAEGDWYPTLEELELLAQVRCPVLAVWGEEDDFLPPHRSAAWLRDYLSRASNREVTLRILPGADHSLFLIDSPEEFPPGYPRLLVDWMTAVVSGP
jgi:pimeloyl-ACP methyl ester carboxylesterase